VVTIQIPDELVRGLEEIAAAKRKSVEQLTVERLRDLLNEPASPQALLRTIKALPHPSRSAVDDLERVFANSPFRKDL
jgi:hypothetical protein